MISRARFSLSPRLRFCPARESGPSDCWLSRKNSIAGCCSTALSMSAKRPSTCGRIASRSNAPAQIRASSPLLAEMQKWLDQNTTSRSVKPHSTRVARCNRASASARKVFWMTLSGCGGGFCGSRRGRVGLHGVRLGHIVRRLIVGRLIVSRFDIGHLAGDLGCHGIQREIAAQSGLLIGRRLRRRFGRRAGFGGGLARPLDLILIGEHGLSQLRRGLQARRLQQHTIGTSEFRLHKPARIGGRVDEIAGCAAAGAEAETVERDERGLQIAGHRYVLRALPTAFLRRARGIIYRSGR